jgi:hypothetical protein
VEINAHFCQLGAAPVSAISWIFIICEFLEKMVIPLQTLKPKDKDHRFVILQSIGAYGI